ncbi:MAG: MarR family transcriptional regulator [Moraxellaceae bacterium]|nr:MarR family transcriptional regulator [Moraxellaceae bacterium]
MTMQVLKVGIISREDYIMRTKAIAKGEYRPKKDEPKVWFESLKSMAEVLSNENQELLRLILEKKPKSLTDLEVLSGRNKSNLSRTLKTLERYGIVELERDNRKLIPKVHAINFSVEFGLTHRYFDKSRDRLACA